MMKLPDAVSAAAATVDGPLEYRPPWPASGRAALAARQRVAGVAPRLLPAPGVVTGAAEARPGAAVRTLSLTSAYGEVLAAEEVSAPEFAAALRRFHDRAMANVNAVVVLDGIRYTRNAFLELVREFNDCAAREARLAAH